MEPIRGEKMKKITQEEQGVDPNAPLATQQFPICPSGPPSLEYWWDNFSKRFSGKKKVVSFESFMKLSKKTFSYICEMVKEEMTITESNYTDLKGEVLTLNDQVAIALRTLSSGEPSGSLGDLLRIDKDTVSQITWCFVEAMETKGLRHLTWPKTEEEMRKIKSKFDAIAGLRNCCGAIDTTKIMFCQEPFSGDDDDPTRKVWCDEENYPCMILQAIVDSEMRFLDIVTGMPGSLSDFNVLCESSFYKFSQDGKMLNGKNLMLSNNVWLGEYIVGDGKYPLLPWLMTPYQRIRFSRVQQNFNERHYQTWIIAKQALRKLKDRWKIIQGIMCKPDKHRLPRIILVCCLLHNIVIDQNDEVMQDDKGNHTFRPNSQECQQQSIGKTASAQRDNLALYLSAELPSSKD